MTDAEHFNARKLRRSIDSPAVMWAINGSSVHKVWPWTHIVCAWLLEKTPAHIFFAADPGVGRELQDGIMETLEKNGADMNRLHPMAGKKDPRGVILRSLCRLGRRAGDRDAQCGMPGAGTEGDLSVAFVAGQSHEMVDECDRKI